MRRSSVIRVRTKRRRFTSYFTLAILVSHELEICRVGASSFVVRSRTYAKDSDKGACQKWHQSGGGGHCVQVKARTGPSQVCRLRR